MATSWCYATYEGTVRTVSETQLYALIEEGHIGHDTMLWHEGMSEWCEAGRLFHSDDEISTVIESSPAIPLKWWQMLFSINGRISRTSFWLYSCAALFVFGFLGGLLVAPLTPPEVGEAIELRAIDYALAVATLFFLWICAALSIKRWHDCNKSGAWIFLHLVPYVGFAWILIENGFRRGTVGDNRYGPDPRNTKSNLAASKNRPQTITDSQADAEALYVQQPIDRRLQSLFQNRNLPEIRREFESLGESAMMENLSLMLSEITEKTLQLQEKAEKAKAAGHASSPSQTITEQTSQASEKVFGIAAQIEKASILDKNNSLVTAKIEAWENERLATVQKLGDSLIKADEQFGLAIAQAVFDSDSEKSRAHEMELFVREISELGTIVEELSSIDEVV